jgi:rod shape determining protein RodA
VNRLGYILRHVDWWLLVPTTYLIALSFVIQYSIRLKTNGVTIEYGLAPHVGAIVGSFVVAIIATYFRPVKWLKTFWVVYGISIVLLLVLLATGGEDVARWLELGGLRFQPTEVVKLATIGVLAGFISRQAAKDTGFKTIAYSLVIVGAPAALIVLQPALGSALVFVAVWSLMVLASPIKLSRLAVIGVACLAVIVFSLPLLKPYQQDRISSFLNPEADSQGSSYNSIQAGIAIGSGGMIGKGLDSGTQSQLNFLPAQHTDFAFAVTAEKLGLVGALSVIVALTALMMRMTYLAWSTRNLYQKLFIVGVVAMFLLHTVINIGMNVGLLPVTGLPLPFISYGGTFMFVCLTSVFLVMIISYYIKLELDDTNRTLQE